MTRLGRTALITGASAGIGAELARVFSAEGFDLVLVARRRERLDALAAELAKRDGSRVRVLVEDLADPAAPERIERTLTGEGILIDALVNNAGYGMGAPFSRTTWKQQADFLQVMLTSVVQLTHLFLPGMLSRKYGRILNVASIAAFVPERPGDMYAPLKTYVVRFSKSLALETKGRGVHVTALCPGYTYSEFHDVLGIRKEVSKTPKIMWREASVVAREGYDAVMKGQAVKINGLANQAISAVCRILPAAAIRALSPAAAMRRKAFQVHRGE